MLTDLKQNSKYYTSIVSPQNHLWAKEEINIKESLLALKLFRVKQHTPMTLALRRAYKEKKISLKEFYKILNSMESFHFKFNAVTQQRSSGTISSFYTNHAISLTKAESHDEVQVILNSLREALKAKIPEFNEFQAGFINLQYKNGKTRNKNLLKYILSRFMDQNSTGVSIDFGAMTIEHLFPQSESNAEIDDIIGSIGNLILIDSKTNSDELKNHNFTKKKEILISKQYPLDEYISETKNWGNSEIQERSKSLASLAFNNLWKI